MSDDYLSIPRHEFEAGDGSFLISLRCDLHWDKDAFTRLTTAMKACCEVYDGDIEQIPRWMANGFWHLSWFVKDWATHPNFPREYQPEYYEHAYKKLFDLADCLFDSNKY